MTGFYIKELRVTGARKKNASVLFRPGLNVISGASDTGKSYVFACLEYMLGREEDPKTITESAGYTDIFLEIAYFNSNESICIHRKIGEKNVHLKHCSISQYFTSRELMSTLPVKHSPKNQATLSGFLLNMCGLNDIKLKTNKENNKESLTFSDLRKFTCIHEERIITEKQPFYYDLSFPKPTKFQSFLKFFLTGNDDSNLVQKEKKEIVETRLKSKIELLKDQLELKCEKHREVIEVTNPVLESNSDELNMQLLETNVELNLLGNSRNEVFGRIQQKKNVIFQKTELKNRFELLVRHYKVDLERLKFVQEGGGFLNQLDNRVCPVCFQDIHEEHKEHIINNDKLIDAVDAEANKIQSKLIDLEDTFMELEATIENLNSELETLMDEYKVIDSKISEELKPKQDFIKNRLDKILGHERNLVRMRLLGEEIKEIEERIAELEHLFANRPKDVSASIALPKLEVDALCLSIEKRLQSWNYDKNVKTTFDSSSKVFDITIGTKLRKSYGKGKRGVSYAACIIGFMDYCNNKKRPFSNLVILDSPLTAYEKNKEDKLKNPLSTDIVNSFYENLAKTPDNRQIIILDNKSPNDEISEKINHILFSGTVGTDRFGFFDL